MKFNVRLFETIDGALSRSNPGAQRKSRLTQQARGATTTDSIATRLHNLAGMSPPAGTPLLSSTPNENMNDTPVGGN